MEQKVLPVAYSANTFQCLETIYEYGAETFSPTIAEHFVTELIKKVDALALNYLQHAECRFLPTKSKKYRMFTFVSYLIIYRITDERIEVLTIIHKSRSITKIRLARRIKFD
jgi:plasmid stabilization system protein ParE